MVFNLIKLAGLVILLAGPLFYLFVWWPVFHGQPALNQSLYKRIRRILPGAGAVYFVAALVQLVMQYRQTGMQTGITSFLAADLHGLVLLNLIGLPLLIVGFARLAGDHRPRDRVWPLGAGLMVLLIEAAGSHAAADPGWLPYLGQLLHLLAAIVWSGGLFWLLMVPWPQLVSGEGLGERLFALDRRFSRLVLYMFIIVTATGVILAFVHVHSEAARIFTPYGQALSLKLLMVAMLTLVLCVYLLRTGPALKRMIAGQGDVTATIRRYRRLAGFEAIVLIAVLAGSVAMRGHEPPDTAPFLNPQTLTISADLETLRINLQPVAGNLNSVRLEIFVPAQLAGGDSTQVFYSLLLPATGLQLDRQEAIRVSANSYQGEATFPVPGDWQIEITISKPDGRTQQLVSPLIIPAQPLIGDVSTYLSPQAIIYNHANMATVATGLLLLVIYGWLVARAGRGGFPQWALIAGTGGVLFGLYLVLSVALVKTYPSTYDRNPLPLTDSVVARGQLAYTTACADCHGVTGKGDGRWTIENRGGTIPDLGSPHIDVHTDGEIYWWITRGIPELDMPARDQELTVEQRWELVNYLRSLRHGTVGS